MARQAVTKAQKAPARASRLRSQPARSPTAAHPLLGLQRSAGNQALGRLIGSPYIQTKLQVSAPGDPFEQEADRVADTVMRMPQPPAAQQPPRLQAKPLVTGITRSVQRESKSPLEEETEEGEASTPDVQRVPLAVREDDDEELAQTRPFDNLLTANSQAKIQRKEATALTPQLTPSVSANIRALRGGGSPLSSSTRAFFEPRFGTDLSHVRLHTDSKAVELNRAISAQAFTHGPDIYLGEGKKDLESTAGKHLLAHELTHTIQQGAATTKLPLITHRNGIGSAGLGGRRLHGIGKISRAMSGLVQRSWIGDRIGWVRTAIAAENWANSDPPGAYYVINGLSMEDMIAVLRSLKPEERKKLSDHLNEQAGKFDTSRIHLALANAATPPSDKDFRERSENLHWAIRSGNFSTPPDGAFLQLAAVDSAQRTRLINALSPDTRKLLYGRLSEASDLPGAEGINSAFDKPSYSVTATTVEGPTYGHCRDIKWIVRWGTQPTLKDGFIVQEVRRISKDFVGSGGNLVKPDSDITFWEVWRVRDGVILEGGEDRWENAPKPWTKGKWEIIGKAYAIEGPLDPKAKFAHSAVDQAPQMTATKIRPDNLGPPTLIRKLNGEWDCTDDAAKPDGFRYHRPFKM